MTELLSAPEELVVATATESLPENVRSTLKSVVSRARAALGETLISIVLFGSGAEGRMRATSDVNVVFVLSRFDGERLAPLRELLRTASVTVQLAPMFILESELADATNAFAVKFGDIARRHRVLWGADVFKSLAPTRAAEIARLQQVLLELTLRMRHRYVLRGLREEQIAHAIAECSGPLRACAAGLLELEAQKFESTKEALRVVARKLGGADAEAAAERISVARESGLLPPGTALPTLMTLIALTESMRVAVKAQV